MGLKPQPPSFSQEHTARLKPLAQHRSHDEVQPSGIAAALEKELAEREPMFPSIS